MKLFYLDGNLKLYSSNAEIFDGPLICDTAPQGMWFSGNTYQGRLTTQTIYPTERNPGNNGRVPAFRLDIKNLLCGPCPWTIYKGELTAYISNFYL